MKDIRVPFAMDHNKRTVVNPYARKKRKRSEEKTLLPSSSTSPSPLPSLETSNAQSGADKTNPNQNLSAEASALIISAADKAGMEGIDRSKIDSIILRESGNSLFIQQQRRRDEKVNQRVQQLQQRLKEASPKDYRVTEELDETIRSYQQQQATRATCVVVDMDMFYMACELLNRPDLNDKPACVGRGMILTSNYVARRYGVRSAMAGFIGDKLVEELSEGRERLIHVPSNFVLYKEKSKIVTEVVREYDPYRMKSYSLDEVYLDIGPYLALFIKHRDYTHEQIRDKLLMDGDVDENGNKINDQKCVDVAMGFLLSQSPLVCLTAVDQVIFRLRQHVQKATLGLTCSAGVARTHAIAKIASDKNKPNGQLVVDPADTFNFVRELPVRKIPGIGRVTEKMLQNVLNIHTGMDLYEKRGLVHFLFKPATAKFLLKASVGCSGEGSSSTFGIEGEEESSEGQKGISRERTFNPESDWTQLNIRLENISRLLAKDMMRKSVMGHTITVKVKLETFDVLCRSKSLKRGVYVQHSEELAAIAGGLFASIRTAYQKKENKNRRSKFAVRLLGIRCSNLIEESSAHNKKEAGTIDKFLTSSKTEARSGASPRKNMPTVETTSSGRRVETNCGVDLSKPILNPYAVKNNGDISPRVKHNRYKQGRGANDVIDDVAIRIERNAKSGLVSTNHNNETARGTQPTKCMHARIEENSQTKDQYFETIEDGNGKETKEDSVVKCPLCNRSFYAKDNDLLNTHIDTCLNGIHGGSTVRQVVKEEELQLQNRNSHGVELNGTLPRGRRQRLTDFWN